MKVVNGRGVMADETANKTGDGEAPAAEIEVRPLKRTQFDRIAEIAGTRGAGKTAMAHFLVSVPESEGDLVAPSLASAHARMTGQRYRRREERLDHLTAALVDIEPRSPVMQRLEAANARLRADYLQAVPTLTSDQVHEAGGSRAANRGALASRWKKEGRIFAVPLSGIDRYPAFQFVDGRPHPTVKAVLAALPSHLSSWQIAFWFAGSNGWLEDAAPRDCLDDRDAVVAAAARMAETTVG